MHPLGKNPLSLSGFLCYFPEYVALFRPKPRELIIDVFPAGEDVCLRCPTKICCKLEPPHIAPVDLRQAFQFKRTQPEFKALVGRQHSGRCQHGPCMFFDHETQLCTIYQNRPLDCQIFPLDIAEHNHRLHWVLYRDDRCELSQLVSEEVLMYAEKLIVPLLSDYLTEFARGAVHPELANRTVWLRELKFPTAS